jgi:dTDP-glucose 4,6-dehydratase
MRLDDGRVVPNFILQALHSEPLTIFGDGLQTRSFCYASDLIEGIYRLLLSDEHMPVNIGNPAEITIRTFAETINRIVNSPAGIQIKEDLRLDDDPQRRRPDITRAKQILDWEPRISLEEGLKLTIEYFKEKIKSL